jgi:three-Cys-motif partner protein
MEEVKDVVNDQEDEPRQRLLFKLPEPLELQTEPKLKRLRHPIWTENKARLIERYLYYFVLITKHGTYIDGFAGPQEPEKHEMWAAKLVLESEPRWLKHFYLFDDNKKQAEHLKLLKAEQPDRDKTGRKIYRDINVFEGDFNALIHDVLGSGCIKDTEATFCLLDQRTFECHWSTLEALARYKKLGSNKVELFYFLAVGWLGRALAAVQNKTILRNWWGRDDWDQLLPINEQQRAEIFAERFKKELGYKSVKPWPIFERQGGGRIMYYMIHATDHLVAPSLMARAYDRAVQPKEDEEQLKFEFDSLPEARPLYADSRPAPEVYIPPDSLCEGADPHAL